MSLCHTFSAFHRVEHPLRELAIDFVSNVYRMRTCYRTWNVAQENPTEQQYLYEALKLVRERLLVLKDGYRETRLHLPKECLSRQWNNAFTSPLYKQLCDRVALSFQALELMLIDIEGSLRTAQMNAD